MKKSLHILLFLTFFFASLSCKAGLYENYVIEYLRCTIDSNVLESHKDSLIRHFIGKQKNNKTALAYHLSWINEYMETGYYEDQAAILAAKIKASVSLDDLIDIVAKVSESSVRMSINKVDVCCNAIYSLYPRRISIYDKCIAEGTSPEQIKTRDTEESYAKRFDDLYTRARIKDIYKENFINAMMDTSKKEKKQTELRLPLFLEDTHNILLNTFIVNGVNYNDVDEFVKLCNIKGFVNLHTKVQTTKEFTDNLIKLYTYWVIDTYEILPQL